MEQVDAVQRQLLDYLIGRAVMPEGANESTELIDSGILDSLQLMDLVMHVQSAFSVRLQAVDVRPDHFRTVACLADLIQQRREPGRSYAA